MRHTANRPKGYVSIVLVVLAGMLILAGCGGNGESDDTAGEDETYRIVTTTTQATDLAGIILDGVEDIQVTALMGAGVDPHLYQPTESDVAAMSEANMVVYSGLHLEGQFDAVFAALREQGVKIYSLSEPVKRGGFVVAASDSDGPSAGDDPHFWFDPRNWQVTVEDFASTMATVDPDNANSYQENSESYLEQLDILYNWATEGMMSVAESKRTLVTSHDAFQYFGAALGWQMRAIQGISTEDEAGVGDIQQTVDFVLENQIPVLFVESSIPPDTIEAVQRAIESAGGTARVGVRELFGDAMGEPGSFGGTYVGMIAHNVLTILQSYELAGEPLTIPEWPDGLLPAPPSSILELQ